MANLSRWRSKLLNHLQEFQPSKYRQLKQAGKLETYLDREVDGAARKVAELRSQGMSEDEATMEVMHNFLPTPEPEPEEAMDRTELERLFGSQIAAD